MNEIIERVRTSNGHRNRINSHSCLFSGGPVPLLRLGYSVRTAEQFPYDDNEPFDFDIDRSKV